MSPLLFVCSPPQLQSSSDHPLASSPAHVTSTALTNYFWGFTVTASEA